MLSQVPTNSRKVAAEGEEAISGYGMPLVPVRFHSRADYAYAMTDGLTAPEYNESAVRLRRKLLLSFRGSPGN